MVTGTSTSLSANGERSRTIGFGFGCNSVIAEAAKWTGQKAVVWPPLAKATEKGKTK